MPDIIARCWLLVPEIAKHEIIQNGKTHFISRAIFHT